MQCLQKTVSDPDGQVHCVYDTSSARKSSFADDGTSVAPAVGSSSGHGDCRCGGVSNHTHHAQLELMYYWATTTSATIGINGQQLYHTQHEISQMALRHQFLLDALFALTSLHLASLRPRDAQVLLDDAIRYQTSGISACRRSLNNLSAAECRAQFQCSVLLGIIAVALHTIDSGLKGPVDTLISLAKLWRGASSIMAVSHDMLGSGMYERLFPPLPLSNVVETVPSDSKHHAFMKRIEEYAKAKDTDRESYVQAVTSLRELLKFSCSPSELYHVLKWAPLVSFEFHDQISEREPLACAVTLLFAVSLQNAEELWWTKGFAKHMVDELGPIILAAQPQWADMVEWAKMKTSRRTGGEVRSEPAANAIAARMQIEGILT